MKRTPTCSVLILLTLIAGNVCSAADTAAARPGIDHRPAVFPPILSLVGDPPTIYILRDPWAHPREYGGVSYDLKRVQTFHTERYLALPHRQRSIWTYDQIDAAEQISIEVLHRIRGRHERRMEEPAPMRLKNLHLETEEVFDILR